MFITISQSPKRHFKIASFVQNSNTFFVVFCFFWLKSDSEPPNFTDYQTLKLTEFNLFAKLTSIIFSWKENMHIFTFSASLAHGFDSTGQHQKAGKAPIFYNFYILSQEGNFTLFGTPWNSLKGP